MEGDGWQAARRILAVRLDTLGDVLMTGPALRALGGAGRSLTLLTSASGARTADLMPEVDDVIVYDAPWLKATAPRESSEPDRAMADLLRARRFDAAAIFTVATQSPLPAALLAHLADIPLRLAHCRENPYGLLSHWVPEPEGPVAERHEVRRQLELVATVGARPVDERLALAIPAAARAQADALLQELGLGEGRPFAVVHPGASAPSRRYPPEGFAAALSALWERHGVTSLLTGSADEEPLTAAVRELATVPAQSLAGRLDLGGLAALLERAPLLISNNTGPVHVAAAVGTPVVDLYALTNPQHTPWMVDSRVLSHDVPCRWCLKSVCPLGHHHCLTLVEPEQVVDAAVELLGRHAPSAPS
jgi:lipopolysaccharide heptosyltransferase II